MRLQCDCCGKTTCDGADLFRIPLRERRSDTGRFSFRCSWCRVHMAASAVRESVDPVPPDLDDLTLEEEDEDWRDLLP